MGLVRGLDIKAANVNAFGPAPNNAPLEISIECRLSHTSVRGASHQVTIHPDWSVTTPHDLDAERIAAALGGYTSCLELAERTVPALKAALPLLTRQMRVPLRRDARGAWRIADVSHPSGCCRSKTFFSIESAARHTRSASHFAHTFDAPQWQLASLMSAAESIWFPAVGGRSQDPEIERLVREVGGILELWHSGIRPDELPGFAAAASAVHEPLPISYFLGMAYGGIAPEWLAKVLRYRPDADTASWLAWLDLLPGELDTNEWGAWLRFGLPKKDVLMAREIGLSAENVHSLAIKCGWSLGATAQRVLIWAKVGCFPNSIQFESLARYGVEYTRPSRVAIDVLEKEVNTQVEFGPLKNGMLDRTTLAILLVILGTRPAVFAALKNGVRGVENIDSYLSHGGRLLA